MRSSRATMRFLPVLMLVLLAVLPAYVGSLWTGVSSLALASDAAPAAGHDAPAEAAPATPGEHAPAAETTAPTGTNAAHKDAASTPAADSSFDPLTLTKSEIDVLRQLAKRRDELDARAKALDDREALLKATEAKIAQQAKQMQQLKAEYEQMKTARDDAAEANLRRLVTVYESMKPEEAARI